MFRFLLSIAAFLAVSLPSAAEQARFSPQAFQIFGGISEGSTAITPGTWDLGPVPEGLEPVIVAFDTSLPPGSVVVRTGERRLYFVLPEGQAIAYHVGVGRDGFAWSGRDVISAKAQWPNWRPPPEMIARERRKGRDIPAFVAGGPGNPLGARALYIGRTAFRIHGTSEPWTIGQAVSSGCIRMLNDDVIDLYDRVSVGAAVVVED
ncbi:L,D-transpeptidase [Aestuariivirga sp.]|uniref:L,D-transpeptidase n=1 Tax=Aestuariivirga sp. TaxID=2650926 RepID=UPI003783FA9F